MRSLQHVMWRGVMALSLLMLGIGSGFGFQEAPMADITAPACDGDAMAAREDVRIESVARADALPARG